MNVDECNEGTFDCPGDNQICADLDPGWAGEQAYGCVCESGYMMGEGDLCVVAVAPAAPTCINSDTPELWSMSGNDYCAAFGMRCEGLGSTSGFTDSCPTEPVQPNPWCSLPASHWAPVGHDPTMYNMFLCSSECPPGEEMHMETLTCVNINECVAGTYTCIGEHQVCVDLDPGWSGDQAYGCVCDTGYVMGEGDMCLPERPNNGLYDSKTACINSDTPSQWDMTGEQYCAQFGRRCDGVGSTSGFTDGCPAGPTQPNPWCSLPASHWTPVGHDPTTYNFFMCTSECPEGQTILKEHSTRNIVCANIDECSNGSFDCPGHHQECVDLDPGWEGGQRFGCVCATGYALSKDGVCA
jgi:hypothetical protein